MRLFARLAVGAFIGLGVLAGIGGFAYAENPTPTPQTPPAATQPGPRWGPGNGWGMGGMMGGMMGGYSVYTTVAELTGFTPQEVQTKRAAGKSFVQIAQEKSVTEQQLVDEVMADHKTWMADRVKAGYLTQDQADAMLKLMESRVKADLEWVPTAQNGGPGFGPGFGPMGRGGCWGANPDQAGQPGTQSGRGRGPGFGMMWSRS